MSLRRILFSDDPKRRAPLTVWLVSAVNYVLFSAIQIVEVAFGLMDRVHSDRLIVAMLGSTVLFYALIRSGAARRFRLDPSLSVTQLVAGIAFGLWSYAVTGPARGAVLMLIVAGLVYAVFSFTLRQSRVLGTLTLLVLAAIMVWRTGTQPERFPPRLELVHFLFTAVAFWGVTNLSGLMSSMRARLSVQAKELQRALASVELLATRDELTQMHNRRHMMELLVIAQRQHERSGAPICLAVIDIDLFKNINDRYGHNAGDGVLKRFAAIAVDCLRAGDLLCRWGGEEFLVVFPEAPLAQAERALKRLHERLRGEVFDSIDPAQRLTFSAGLTAVDPSEPIELATERADRAMYRAKRGGRDRTVLAELRELATPLP